MFEEQQKAKEPQTLKSKETIYEENIQRLKDLCSKHRVTYDVFKAMSKNKKSEPDQKTLFKMLIEGLDQPF